MPRLGTLEEAHKTLTPLLGSAASMVFAMSLLACYLPVRRAAMIDPADTLRAE